MEKFERTKKLEKLNIDAIAPLFTVDNMAMADLAEDGGFARLPAGRKKEYIARLVETAEGAADRVKKEYPGAGVLEICRAMGLSADLAGGPSEGRACRFRAEIFCDEKKININATLIERMSGSLARVDFFDGSEEYNSMDKLTQMHIAHELYHYIEYAGGIGATDTLPELSRFKIFGFERRIGVLNSAEAAAHIFCMRMLDLPFHPKMLDLLCLLSEGEVTFEALSGYLQGLNGQLN